MESPHGRKRLKIREIVEVRCDHCGASFDWMRPFDEQLGSISTYSCLVCRRRGGLQRVENDVLEAEKQKDVKKLTFWERVKIAWKMLVDGKG